MPMIGTMTLVANAAVEGMYTEQKPLEDTEDTLERARAAARDDHVREARFVAQKMLGAFEAAEREGREYDTEAMWEKIRLNDRSGWVENIIKSHDDYAYSTGKARLSELPKLFAW